VSDKQRRVVIVGSRPPKPGAPIEDHLAHEVLMCKADALVDSLPPDVQVVSGGAPGVDQRVLKRARGRSLATLTVWPMKRSDGTYRVRFVRREPGAGDAIAEVWWSERSFGSFAVAAYWRNCWMVDWGTEVHALHFNGSRGTANSIRLAERAGKLTEVIR
jgi:hypothetical protein